jgi:Ca-activated chloride channel family protein
MNRNKTLTPKLVLTPLQNGVCAAGGSVDVLVRVQAPAQPIGTAEHPVAKRAPLRLALVVDRSGSMDGEPLTQALRCVNHIAGRLQTTDQLAVVLYDDQVQVPLHLHAAGQAARVQAALAGVTSGGSTALFDGWLAGAQQLEGGTPSAISRVILLSDGQANHGEVDPARIAAHCADWFAKGVSTTTVGLGRGFNEELMIGMAKAGGGQQYYGQTAEDLYDGFDQELALLESLYLRKLKVKLIAGPGVIAETLGLVHPCGDHTYELADLAWGAESWLLVRLHVTPGTSAQRPLLAITLEAQDMDGQAIGLQNGMLALDSLSEEVLAALPKDEAVAARLLEVKFGETSAKARWFILQGDLKSATHLLDLAAAEFEGHPWLKVKLAQLRELAHRDAAMAAKEMMFNTVKMSRRLASSVEVQYSIDETESTEVPAFLRRKGSEGSGRRQS